MICASDAQTGVAVRNRAFVRLEGMEVEAVGQAGICVGQMQTGGETPRLTGRPSHHCDVIGNVIRDTGRVTARYGEGVYIGTGGLQGDATHDVFVAANRIEGARAEAIELKPFTTNINIRGDTIIGGSHFFHGAISVGAQAFDAPDGNYIVEGNLICGYGRTSPSPVAGIAIGHGNTIVRDNVIGHVESGIGIRTTTTFVNPDANAVLLEGNTVWTPSGGPSIALHLGDERTGVADMPGDVTMGVNWTDDGSAGSLRVPSSSTSGADFHTEPDSEGCTKPN